MRYRALACDYDGTLARDGTVGPAEVGALERCRASGRRLILVTGRVRGELQALFDRLDLFDCVVAENGASLYSPSADSEQLLASPLPEIFTRTLRARGVSPLAVGRVVVATRSPFETIVLKTIRDLGLELQVIFNKGSVMVLPSGVNKATGLCAALARLHVSLQNVVAIGDAENDHALLEAAAVGVAVANAVPTLLQRADLVTAGAEGQGVTELIDRLIDTDLAGIVPHARPAGSG